MEKPYDVFNPTDSRGYKLLHKIKENTEGCKQEKCKEDCSKCLFDILNKDAK